VKKSFNIQGLLHHKSKCHGTTPMHLSSLRALPRHQKHNLKYSGLVDLIATKQNKLPSFIDRYTFRLKPLKQEIYARDILFYGLILNFEICCLLFIIYFVLSFINIYITTKLSIKKAQIPNPMVALDSNPLLCDKLLTKKNVIG
jgi:hypothetical protein